jgi:hypothetical protein
MLAQQRQVNAAAAQFMRDTSMFELYSRVALHPKDFPKLLDKIGAMMAEDFDYSEQVRGLQVPMMIVCADADMARRSRSSRTCGCGSTHQCWRGRGRTPRPR